LGKFQLKSVPNVPQTGSVYLHEFVWNGETVNSIIAMTNHAII